MKREHRITGEQGERDFYKQIKVIFSFHAKELNSSVAADAVKKRTVAFTTTPETLYVKLREIIHGKLFLAMRLPGKFRIFHRDTLWY